MADDALVVRFGARPVGRLRADETGRFCFAYDPVWMAGDDAFPISISLPLRDDEYRGGAGQTFFANLLPEGAVRLAVCNRLGISEGNDYALLRAIGGDCAGALSIVEADAPPPDPQTFRYEILNDARLQELAEGGDIVPLLAGGPSTRLSLAGAQDKLPVAMLDGEPHLPVGDAPSTHIIKLPHPRYAHLPVNEAFVSGLAAHIGFDAAATELLARTDPPGLLVERYDRLPSDTAWPAQRLHQEDLCQALARPPTQKYQQEGGPSLVDAVEVIRTHSHQPLVDVQRLIQWQAFNIVAGNSDGHGKNLSILYEGSRRLRLAPFYDLLSTRHYAGLDRLLAMSVGDRRDPDQVSTTDWQLLASQLGVGKRVVIDLAGSVAQRILDGIDAHTENFRARHGAQPILQTIPQNTKKRAHRLLRPRR